MLKKKLDRNERGFALVIAVSLMALLILLLIGMSALVQIELKTAGVNRQRDQARANAQLGLLVALGRLQSLAGPDQRVTATADILNSAPGSLDGIPGMTDAMNHWTGVWKVEHDEATDTYEPQFQSFLISGMPEEPGDVMSEAANYNSGDESEYIEILDGGSVKRDAAKVLARKEQIGTTGRYAYWVGDEGVKARINVLAEVEDEPPALPVSRTKLGAPPKTPASVMTGLGALSEDSFRLTDVKEMSEIQLADTDVLDESIRERYHDITLNSVGLMTNTAKGGLKKDLSLAFELPDEVFNSDEFFAGTLNAPSNAYPFLEHKFQYVYNKPCNPSDPASKTIRGPTWHVLRNYYRQYKEVLDTQSSPAYDADVDKPLPNKSNWYDVAWSIPSIYSLYWKRLGEPLTTDEPVIESGWLGQPPNIRPTEGAVTPVVTRVQNIFSVRKVPLSSSEQLTLPPAGSEPSHTSQLQIVWDPIITIWNPYNVNLKFEGFVAEIGLLPLKYSIRPTEPAYLYHSKGVTHPVDPTLPKVNGVGIPITTYHENIPFQRLLGHAWDTDNNWEGSTHSIIFRIGEEGSPIEMKPGEVLVYSFGSSSPVRYNGNAAQVITAVPGFEGTGGFAFDTGLTGSNAQSIKLVIESDEDGDEYSTMSFFLVTDWSKVPDGKSVKKTTMGIPGAVYMGNIWPKQANKEDYGRAPSSGEIEIPFSSLSDIKQPFAQLDYYMKTSDVSREAVALGVYNNPRARSFSAVGENPKYKTADPIWGYRLHEITSITDVAQVSPENRGYWGESNVAGTSFVTLFEVPTAPLTSLGQLMHANITFRGHYPLYPLGSSFASPDIPRDQFFAEYKYFKSNICVPDVSYLINEALWDGYFFSSLVPESSIVTGQEEPFAEVSRDFANGDKRLINSRMEFMDVGTGADGFLNRMLDEDESSIAPNAYEMAAGNIGIKGAFNINSTSIEAWKSILSGLRDEAITYLNPETGGFLVDKEGERNLFSKFTLPNGSRQDAWSGYARLSDEQIKDLAEAIVRQIHKRGPFPTLASFVNREMSMGETGLAGVIEAAIQETSTINSDFYSYLADPDILNYPQNIRRYGEATPLSRETGIPGFLTQADVLMAIGGMINNRSDTFVIRSYGETLDPLTNKPTAEAWLEAVVQRVGSPVEPESDDPTLPGYFQTKIDEDGNDRGRTFRIVSVRWLSKDEV